MEQHVHFAASPSLLLPQLAKPQAQETPFALITGCAQSALTPKGFNRKQVYYKFLYPSYQHFDFRYNIGLNRLRTPFNKEAKAGPGGLWFCTKRQLPIIGLPYYTSCPGVLIVEVRVFESSNVVEVCGNYKSDAIHISNPKTIPEFFRGCEVAAFEINPEFAVRCLPLPSEIRRFLIQRNPYNLLEFSSYTFEEALEACKRDRDLIDDIAPAVKQKVIAALRTSRG
jgi:hypothetical protein